MKNLLIKLRRVNAYYKYLFYLTFTFYLVSIVLISRSLLLLSGIETLIRMIIIVTFVIVLCIYLVSNLAFLILKKHKHIIICAITVLIFSIVNYLGFYYINKTYGYIDNIRKDTILYTTNLISMTDTNELERVGMIDKEEDVVGYILPQEYLSKNKSDYEIEYYDDYYDMLNALYDGEIDGLFITSDYVILYQDYERFQDIKTATKILDKYSKEMSNQDLLNSTNKPVTEPFTILFIGVDSEHDGLAQNAAFNGDTLLLVTFNPKTLNMTMFGIPRDTYVPISCNNNRKYKINSAAAYGSKCMLNTIEDLTGIEIDYYMKINFKGVVDLVDALGGINVDVPVPDYKSAYCVEDSNRVAKKICLEPGLKLLNGEEALALTRVRDAFAIGDFKRVQNQQLVLEGMAKKAKSIRSMNDFLKVLEAISKNLDSNMDTKQMLNFYNVGKDALQRSRLKDDEFISIQRTFLTGYDLTIGNYAAYAFQYYEKSLNDIIDAMLINLDLKEPELIKTFSFSVNEIYEQEIIGKIHSSEDRLETLPSFIDKSVEYVNNWNEKHHLDINFISEKSNICINNTILKQSIKGGVLVSSISSLNLTVCENYFEEIVKPDLDEDEDEDDIDDIIEDLLE